MNSLALPYFGVVLFLALVFLARWKRRHDAKARMNRGLTSYVSAEKGGEAEVGAAEATVQLP
jgi:hypothetical protein